MTNCRIPKVYIIVLNWNGWRDTTECVESILNSEYENYEIIIVDNNSSEKLVQDEFDYMKDKGIIFIQSDKNLGYAGGNNLGIKYAIEKKDADYIWVLNNDTVVTNNTLTELCNYSRRKALGVCGSTVVYYGSSTLQCAGGAAYNAIFSLNKYIYKNWDISDISEDEKIKFDYVAGCSMFIDINTILKIGLLCEDYFLYYEEMDYCFRAKMNSINIGWCKDSVIYHKEGASINKGNKKGKSLLSEYYGNLSALKFSKKFYSKYFIIIFLNRFLLKFIKNTIFLRFDLNKELLRAYHDIIFE